MPTEVNPTSKPRERLEITYDNDTGPSDEYFHEFWRISLDGQEIAITRSGEDAILIKSWFKDSQELKYVIEG